MSRLGGGAYANARDAWIKCRGRGFAERGTGGVRLGRALLSIGIAAAGLACYPSVGLADTVSFNSVGQNSWTVPSGVFSATFDVYGAQGAAGWIGSGGLGGEATATLSVSPGQTLQVNIGGAATASPNNPSPGGANGGGNGGGPYGQGGGGGGATDVRAAPFTLADRVLVAGGGGGGGNSENGVTHVSSDGGGGGGATGGAGKMSGGQGGTENGGGSGTAGGAPGVFGSGGAGTCSSGECGGGGGGGWYGGGGGWDSGGGGSGYGPAGVTFQTGVQTGNGKVVITYAVSPSPAAVSGTAAKVTETDAVLNGTVNPEGLATTYHFEYGTSTSYGSSTPDTSAGLDSADHAETQAISGLASGTTYHFRIVATSGGGTTAGADQVFTTSTPPSPAAVSGAVKVGETDAVLNGTVNPEGLATTYHFEYGTSTSYGSSTPDTSAGLDSADHAETQAISGLASGTTYHFRIVATSGGGTTAGADQVFTTTTPRSPAPSKPPSPSPPPPQVQVGAVQLTQASSLQTAVNQTIAQSTNPTNEISLINAVSSAQQTTSAVINEAVGDYAAATAGFLNSAIVALPEPAGAGNAYAGSPQAMGTKITPFSAPGTKTVSVPLTPKGEQLLQAQGMNTNQALETTFVPSGGSTSGPPQPNPIVQPVITTTSPLPITNSTLAELAKLHAIDLGQIAFPSAATLTTTLEALAKGGTAVPLATNTTQVPNAGSMHVFLPLNASELNALAQVMTKIASIDQSLANGTAQQLAQTAPQLEVSVQIALPAQTNSKLQQTASAMNAVAGASPTNELLAKETSQAAGATAKATASPGFNIAAAAGAVDVTASIISLALNQTQLSETALLAIQQQISAEATATSILTNVMKGESDAALNITRNFHAIDERTASPCACARAVPASQHNRSELSLPFTAPAPGQLHAWLSVVLHGHHILLATINRRMPVAGRTVLKLALRHLGTGTLTLLRGRRVTARIVVSYHPAHDQAVTLTRKLTLRLPSWPVPVPAPKPTDVDPPGSDF